MWVWESQNAKGVFVLVHGANEHHARYTWLIDKLVKDEFHVVMGDLPGQGENPKYKGHIDSFQEYIDTITMWYERAVQFQLPVFLLGHSMGGLAVIQTMLKKNLNVNAVILSSPCLALVNRPSKLTHYSSLILNKVSPKIRVSTNLKKGSGTRCQKMRKWDESDPHSVKKISVRWYFELVAAMNDSHREVKNFPDVPLLLLQGGNDLIVDKESVIPWFNNLNITEKYYKEWPGLYHEVFNEPEKEKVYNVARMFTELHLSQD
jgi:lysophospholipase